MLHPRPEGAGRAKRRKEAENGFNDSGKSPGF
nr:MAG TPA_asm: hypothetical protein [Bacteriophage sp.]